MMTPKTYGSRREVWYGLAKKTTGGLTRSNLLQNKKGRIVSKKRHMWGKKKGRAQLRRAGYDLASKATGFGPRPVGSGRRSVSRRPLGWFGA